MPDVLEKIFVYGTLLRGEPRSRFMQDCELSGEFEVPGRIFDTGQGYPAAVFDAALKETVYGELYLMENAVTKLRELDQVEGTGDGLFKRVKINQGGIEFYSYEPGRLLEECVSDKNRILRGVWRNHSSLALTDPVDFALGFENHLKKTYRQAAGTESDGTLYVRGHIPVLVTSPHATAHVRMGKLKRQEFYTGALSVMLHSVTGCHALYTDRLSGVDPNYYDESPFKKRLAGIASNYDIGLIIDIHGTGSERKSEIYPGVGRGGEFLLGNNHFLSELEEAAALNNISLGGLDVFPAVRQMTVTKFAATGLGIPAIQLEINRDLRQPERTPSNFTRLFQFLTEFIEHVSR
ncbi:MAG: gamma-glutamylcyclotransferase [Deltaproteobacteria bacterium]